jgi:hypothetical protein
MSIPTYTTSEADTRPIKSQSDAINIVDGVSVILDELPAIDGDEISHGPHTSSPDDNGNHLDSETHKNNNREVAVAVDTKGSASNVGDSKDNFPPISPLVSLVLSSVFPSSFSKKEELLEKDAVSDEYLGTISENSVILECVERDILDTLALYVDVDNSSEEGEGNEIPEEFLIKLFSKKEVFMIYVQLIWIYLYVYLYMNL